MKHLVFNAGEWVTVTLINGETVTGNVLDPPCVDSYLGLAGAFGVHWVDTSLIRVVSR